MPARKRPAYDATVPRVGKPEWDLAWGIDDVQNRLHSVVHTEVKPTAAARERVERNEPCTCGSGKKFKKCCGSPVGVR